MSILGFIFLVALAIMVGASIALVGLQFLDDMVGLYQKRYPRKRKTTSTYRKWFYWGVSKDNAVWVIDITIYGLVIQAWRTSFGKEGEFHRINLWWNLHEIEKHLWAYNRKEYSSLWRQALDGAKRQLYTRAVNALTRSRHIKSITRTENRAKDDSHVG